MLSRSKKKFNVVSQSKKQSLFKQSNFNKIVFIDSAIIIKFVHEQ